MLEIPFDFHALFIAEDDEILGFSWLVDRVDASRREQMNRAQTNA